MAEYHEIVGEFFRMCKNIRETNHNTCDRCPIKIASLGTSFNCYRYILEFPEESEDIVMRWASENPKPVYPSWHDYLHSIGVLYKKHTAGGDVAEINWGYMMAPMPADIAQKLGIEPKEG